MDNKAKLDIQSLPAILNFHEEDAPMLQRTHRRIVEAARADSFARAEAASNTYQELAEAHVENQVQQEHLGLPKPIQKSIQAKAKCGILIKIADIWQEAGVMERCLGSLDRAIRYAKTMRWNSIATALELEKQKLQSVSG